MARRVMTLEQNVGMQNLRNSSTKFEKNKVPVGLKAEELLSYPDNDIIFGATSEEAIVLLAKSIKETGLTTPLNVWKLGNGRYMIYGGHRRNTAVLYNNKLYNTSTIIPCFIEDYPTSEFERIRKFLDSNLLSRGGIKGLREDESLTCENISRIIREVFKMLKCGKKELKEINKLRKANGEELLSFDEWFSQQFFNGEVDSSTDVDEESDIEEDADAVEESDGDKGNTNMRNYVAKYLGVKNASYIQSYRNICDCPKEVINAIEYEEFPLSVASNMASKLSQEKQLLIYETWLRAKKIHKEKDDGLEVTRDDMYKVVRFVKKNPSASSVEELIHLLFSESVSGNTTSVSPSKKDDENIYDKTERVGETFSKDKTTASKTLPPYEQAPSNSSSVQDASYRKIDSGQDTVSYTNKDDSFEKASLNSSLPVEEKSEKKTLTNDDALQKFLKTSNSLEELLSDNIADKYEFDANQKRIYDEKLEYLEKLIINVRKMR